jgi:DNA polymerase-3 subunit gamma/tau
VAYQVLARKWRPQTFDQVFGQNHVTTPLRNAIRSGRIPHALLLTGPRGTGKTTLARIFACCLNAEKGPTDEPNPDDPACLEIAAGTSTDVQEIDAASRTSVDDVREIIDAIRYAAAPGKHRIFIVDEVHMLSTPAFNALLKTLEEPPPKSLFIFCTTNPEKIPFTVVSRCQRYDLRRIATAEVSARLEEIAKAEGVKISDHSLAAVARAGDGSLRDALTLLDQLIAVGDGVVDDERVAEVLDLIDRHMLLAIAEACVDGDAAAALVACRQAFDAGIEARRLGGALLGTLRDLVVLRAAPGRDLVEGADAEVAALTEVAGRTDEARLRRMFRALLREQEDLAWAPDPFAVLEMAVIRMAGLASGADVEQLLSRIDALERKLRGEDPGGAPPAASGSGSGGRAAAKRGGSAAKAGPTASSAEAPRATAPADPSAIAAAAPEPEPPPALPPAAEARAAAPPAQSAPEGAVPAEGGAASPELTFDRLRGFAQEANRGLFASLEGGQLLALEEKSLRIALPSGIAARRLESRIGELHQVVERFFGRPLTVALEVAGATQPQQAAAAATVDSEELRRQRQKEALNHPTVNDALEILGGEILEIRPLGGSQ